MSDVKYLIFDIETVGDGNLIRRVKYPGDQMTEDEAVRRFRADLLADTGRDVLPPTFVRPVSVAIGKVTADFRLQDICVLDAPHFRPTEIARRFWWGWGHYGRPTLVTFNGRGYDLPVLELEAFRNGFALPAWFNVESKSWDQSRNRYNIDRHIDLQDFFSNFGAMRVSGGLNLLSNLIWKPGKSGIDGSQVQDMYFEGRTDEINDYCRCDVLDTYFVFLRSRVLMGRLTSDAEEELAAEVRAMLLEQADSMPSSRTYLEYWDARLQQQSDVDRNAVVESDSGPDKPNNEPGVLAAPAGSRETMAADDSEHNAAGS